MKIPDQTELEEVKGEEAVAIEKSLGITGSLDAEPEFHESEIEVMDVGQ